MGDVQVGKVTSVGATAAADTAPISDRSSLTKPFSAAEGQAARATLAGHVAVSVGIGGPGGFVGVGVGGRGGFYGGPRVFVPSTYIALNMMPATLAPGYCVVQSPDGLLYQTACGTGFALQPGFTMAMRPTIVAPAYGGYYGGGAYYGGNDWSRRGIGGGDWTRRGWR